MTLVDETLAEVRAEEAGAAGDEDALHRHGSGSPWLELLDAVVGRVGHGCVAVLFWC